MQKSKALPKNHFRLIWLLLILLFSFSGLFILSACSQNSEPVASSAGSSPEFAENAANTNPGVLNEEDKVLSLEGYGAKGALADTDLSIADMLVYAVQDEYLARGEYAAIIEKFGSQNPYKNIILAEETHIAYLEEIYTVYDMTFPDDNSDEHIVVPQDLLEAAQTGVQAEIDNIAMYELFLSNQLPEDIYQVFSALKNASESHLLAFQKQVDKLS